MKNILKLMLLPALVLPFMLTSCSEDDDDNPTLDLSHVNEEFKLNTPADATNNTYDLVSANTLTLTCTQPNYGGVPYPVRYYVQASLDNNFTDSTQFVELSTSYTTAKMGVDASELNNAVCQLYQKGDNTVKVPTDMPVNIRLRAIIDNTDNLGQTYSNVITLPHVQATYVAPLATIPGQLYIQGAANNNGAIKSVPPIYGVKSPTTNSYYTMVYMPAGGTLKFGATTDKLRGFSNIFAVDDQASAGVSESADGDIAFANAGWYTLVFDDEIAAGEDGRLTESHYTLHVYEAKAYVIGAGAGGDWTDANATWELTKPDANGDWVSPAFTGAGELRAYIKVPKQDWWRTEFTIFNGKAFWRLVNLPNNWNDDLGAEYSVKVAPGQKLYVNFDNGDASVK
ncbi:outer membrane protein SusE [Prevotella lacticifex]|uniref:SusF/SusE family outer membrane protein n=1 Tax=Prevotella lacticifex TaxID=2854755 RepID=UPI001CC50513|nr:SusE domain-containing protein [Prevotella lacticifex]MDD6863870.1 SusE domain-containing protein [Prevotella sp.]GJG66604.1 outer membrane protein SusE [Prevotella lacticifex]